MKPVVVHLVISLAPGGLERMVVDLTNERNRLHPGSTRVCCLDEPGSLASQVEGGVVACVQADRSRFPFDVAAVRKLRKLLSRVRSQETPNIQHPTSNTEPGTTNHERSSTVLHAHNLAAWQYGALATIGTGVRLVYTQHGANVHNRGFVNRLRCALLARVTDRMVTVSESTAKAMVENQGIAREKIVVIPNGVRTGEQRTDDGGQRTEDGRQEARDGARGDARRLVFRTEHGIPENAFVVGSVGRFSPEKNYPLLVRAFAGLRATCPQAFLLLVGDGDERSAIEDAVREHGVSEGCLLPGFQDPVDPWLKAMDVFCLSSDTEGLSISLLEAGVAGLPLVVTAVGGNGEIVQDGATGFVVSSGDGRALQRALESVCRDESLRRRLGTEAARRTAARFSLDAAVSGYERVYGESRG